MALLIAALAIQPAFVTRQPDRQSSFTWEMYAKGAPRDEFVVDYGERSERLTVADVQPRGLATIDYAGPLPAFICEKRQGAVRVTVLRADKLVRVHECAP